jgi:acyl-CoA synthetase (AMP-forming)/AMP-acid ligase II
MRNFTVYDIFERNAAIHGSRIALVCNDNRITFSDLLCQVNTVAYGMKQQGIKKGDRIAILSYNCHSYFVIMGAAAACGAIVVAINWRLSPEEIRHILVDSAPIALFYDQNCSETVKQLSAGNGYAGQIYCLEDSGSVGIPLKRLMDGNMAFSGHRISSDDPFCIIYTAAVAGKSRGAVLTHANITFGNLQTIATMGLDASDTYLNMLPLFHITGLNLALSVMHAGGKNVVMDRFDPRKALEWIDKEGVSVIGSFPPILSNLQSEMDQNLYVLSTLRHVLGIDQPDTIQAFEGRTRSVFWILYGQTETSGMVTFSPASEKPGSAGKQGFLIHMQIVDENDRPVAVGETGEIVVQGPLVFQGFWNQAEYNRNIFRNGCHHTGDMGRMDPDGYLWFAGRKPEKELIKPGGENVYPAEVESVILEHPSVEAVSVIGVPDPKFGEGIKAVCVLKSGFSLSAETLMDFVASRIARYKKPRYVQFVDALPQAGDGTIDRVKVKMLYG